MEKSTNDSINFLDLNIKVGNNKIITTGTENLFGLDVIWIFIQIIACQIKLVSSILEVIELYFYHMKNTAAKI